ncbi:uncharacterized protein LOC132261603 [Phlebotomus argentipes]|uniref:uncharacterized protein LOC132261603 n=1 Tax=Phlebotomus argentipes TaxID=94469 RepID=UPI0028932474|nr:uncharacterized protein LOC132261603 [Phlebotomus argentipes]
MHNCHLFSLQTLCRLHSSLLFCLFIFLLSIRSVTPVTPATPVKRTLHFLANEGFAPVTPTSYSPHRVLPTLVDKPLPIAIYTNNVQDHYSHLNSYLPPPPPTAPANLYFPPAIISPTSNGLDDEEYYHHEGRLLKQYLVREEIYDYPAPEDTNPLRANPLAQLPARYANQIPYLVSSNLLVDHPFKPDRLHKNHGPIALGSGSLGYIQLPNGVFFLGSGSLGYISQKQYYDSLTPARVRQLQVPGPLTFGHNDR